MGKLGVWALLFVTAAFSAGCGSKQPSGGTTAHEADGEIAEEPSTVAVSESEPVVFDPDAEEPDEETGEDRERRDVKMMSYEEAMALPMEIGDVSADGGEAQLTGETIARVMDGELDGMYHACIKKELRRGNPLGTVTMDLAIRGKDGMVLGTTIDPGRRRFKKCLEDYLEDVRFPTFAAARMGARYRFYTD